MLNALKDNPWGFSLCLVMSMAILTMPELALAQGGGGASGNTIANVLCNVVEWFTGPVGKGIATLAIIIIGIGALMGKVSWGMAIIVGVGVAVIFGADQVVNELGAGSYSCV